MKKLFFEYNSKVTNFDYFALLNSMLFLVMCIYIYYDWFVGFRGETNIHEFFIYALVIFSVIFFIWIKYRQIDVMISLLVMIQIGVLMHFFGEFIEVDGQRLYNSSFFNIRYDKYVHFINSMIATFAVLYFFTKLKILETKFIYVVVVMTVLGLGGIVEIIEFSATFLVKHNGVGSYTNNMFDLVSNFCGSISMVLLFEYFLKGNQRR